MRRLMRRGSQVKVLTTLHKTGVKPHFPFIYFADKIDDRNEIVVSFTGPTLDQLLELVGYVTVAVIAISVQGQKSKNCFSDSTWLRIGMQCLVALKTLHDHGFVHR